MKTTKIAIPKTITDLIKECDQALKHCEALFKHKEMIDKVMTQSLQRGAYIPLTESLESIKNQIRDRESCIEYDGTSSLYGLRDKEQISGSIV